MEELDDALVDEQLGQIGQVFHPERVDDDAFLFGCKLDEAQAGPIGLLSEEFRIDGEDGGSLRTVGELLQLLPVGNVQRFSFV